MSFPSVLIDSASSAAEAAGTVKAPLHAGHQPDWPALESGACTFARHVGQKKRIINPFLILQRAAR